MEIKIKKFFFQNKKKFFFRGNFEKKIMITLAKVKDSFVENLKLIIKVLQFGPKTAKQSGPFGIDSNPLDNYTAIYSETSNVGEAVILGYINKNYITEKGEIRIFSLNDLGEVQAYAYARKSGVLELNGNQFSSVRFENLQNAINAKDSLINTELAKIAVAIGLLGGSYTAANVSTNLTESKSEKVRIK